MLQNIRDRAHGFLVWTIIIFICGSFALWGIHNYVGGNGPSREVAKVEGVPILRTDLRNAYEQLNRQEQMLKGTSYIASPELENKLRHQALENLINSQLLIIEAIKMGYRISPLQVNTLLWNLPLFQADGKFSQTKLEQFLRHNGLSVEAYLNNIRDQLLVNQVSDIYGATEFILPTELSAIAKIEGQKRDFSYAIITKQSFAKNIQLTAQEKQTYYQNHLQDFLSPEQVSIQYLELSLPKMISQMHFTDAELNQYYQSNLDTFKKSARWNVSIILIKVPKQATPQQVTAAQDKINKIYKEVTANNFAKLAGQYSEDLITAKQQGELGWVDNNTVSAQLETIIAKLSKKNPISAPTRTDYGFSILKLNDEEPAKITPFAQVKSQVQQSLAEQKAQQQFADASDKLADLVYSNSDNLNAAAQALNLPIQTTGYFSRKDGTDNPLTTNPKVIAAAFTPEVMQQAYNSNPIQLDDQTVVVLRMKDHKPSSQLTFAQVENKISDLLTAQKEQALAEQQAKVITQQLAAGGKWAQLMQQYNLHAISQQNIARTATKIDTTILQEAFSLSSQIPSTQEFALPSGDYVVMQLTAVHDGVVSSTSSTEQNNLINQLTSKLGQLDYQLYLASLKQHAKIVINKDLTTSN